MPLTVEDEAEAGPGGLARLEALFRAHHDHLVRLGTVMTGDPSLGDDLAQEAFVRLGRVRRWPAEGAELAYLRRTVINLAHGHHRRAAVGRKHTLSVVTTVADPAVDVARRDDQRRVLAAVRALPRRQMECVVLRYYAQLADAEIADVLEISVGSVKTHLHRSRAALASALEGER